MKNEKDFGKLLKLHMKIFAAITQILALIFLTVWIYSFLK